MPTKKITDKVTEKKQPVVKTQAFFSAVGRRKEAIAQVRLTTGGDGKITINGRTPDEYFRGQIYRDSIFAPLRATNTMDRYAISVKVKGSGLQGQLGAVINGIAKALLLVEPEKFRPVLREKGYLTRDSRTRERRKVGQMGRARKKKQSPKR